MRKFSQTFIFLLFVSCAGENRDNEFETKLLPVIEFVESHIKDQERLPSREEFRTFTRGLNIKCILLDSENEYAIKHGATRKLDYMVGIWRSDWYFYYKSWDKNYFNADDQ